MLKTFNYNLNIFDKKKFNGCKSKKIFLKNIKEKNIFNIKK